MATSTLERVDPRRDDRWARLVADGRGSLFTSPPWVRAVAGTYGFEVAAHLLVDRAGQPAAGFVFADVDDARGARIVSFPFSDRCDPIAGEDQWARMIGPLLEREVPVTLRCLDCEPAAVDPRFVTTGVAAWHGTDLARSEDEIFAGLSSSARQNVRRAQRDGVTVHLGTGIDDVRAFHDLHCHLRKHKYRLLAPPVELFERLWAEFEPSGSIWVALARHEGDVVAGALYLSWDGVAYYKFGASLPDRLRARPNELIAWTSIQHARDRGCHLYDWGLSDLDQPGLVAFKDKFATCERRIVLRQHRPDGAEGVLGGAATTLIGELVELLTRDDVPDEVTRRAGEIAYGNFC
jgi:Acetyltransferase (GNAT) domain